MKKMKSPQDIYAYAQNRQTIEKPEKNENHDGSWMPTHSLDILSKTLTPTIFKNVNFFGDWSIVENLRLFLALGNPFTFNAVKIGTFWAFLAPKGNTGTQSDKEFSNNVEKPCLVDVTKFDPNANDYTMRSVMIGGFVFLNTSEYDTVRDEKTIYDVKGIEIRDGKMTDKRLDYIMKRMRGDYIKKHKGSGLIWIFYKKATKNCKAIILDVIILDEHGKHVDKLQTKFYIPEEKVKTNAEVRIKVNKKGECEIEEVPDFNDRQHIHYFYQTVKKPQNDASEPGEKFETKIIEKSEIKKMKSPEEIYALNGQTIEKPEKNENHDGSWMPTHSLDILSKTLTRTIFENVHFFGDWSIYENLRFFLTQKRIFIFYAVKIGTFWALLAPKGNTGTQSDKEFSNNVEKPCLVDVTKFDPNANDYTMRSVVIGGFVFLNTSEYDECDGKTIYDVKRVEIQAGEKKDKMRQYYIKKHKGSGLIWFFYRKATKKCKATIRDVVILDEHGMHADESKTSKFCMSEKELIEAIKDIEKADLQIEDILKKLSDYQVKTNAEIKIQVNEKGECEIEEIADFDGIEIYEPHVSRMREDYSDLKCFDFYSTLSSTLCHFSSRS
ncbi:unnamed protein product, partial [Mesorhabditis belari]|uniref:Uncharacterized protein n=1 Tax=Mesorhabditis belari TaxID=2138241 RepID=A0AAF3EV98_9BILA